MLRHRPRYPRLAAAGALTAAAVIVLGTPAFAHVTVDPREVPGGGYRTINVKVPNERDDASTTQVELFLDPDHPVASVMPEAVPGWEVEIEVTELDEPLEVHGNQITEAPSKITWSGGEITPGMFQQFPVSMGRLPEGAGQLVLKAIQTYDSGEIVRWIDEPAENADHPAALLTLTAEDGDHGAEGEDGKGTAEDAGEDQGQTEAAATADTSASDTTARVMAGVGIAIGAIGTAIGVLGARAGRRRTSTDS